MTRRTVHVTRGWPCSPPALARAIEAASPPPRILDAELDPEWDAVMGEAARVMAAAARREELRRFERREMVELVSAGRRKATR